MRIIGITGGIGSGKSTVSGILAASGARVIDADAISRQVAAKGGKALLELQKCFGIGIITPEGELDRKKLAGIVFGNAEKLEDLNKIMHKYIAEEISLEVNQLMKIHPDLIVIDAPIPLKYGFLDLVDEVWVVAADKDTRIKRVMKRSSLTENEAVARIDSQMQDEEYIKIADKVIYNNQGQEELERTVEEFLQNNLR